MAKLIWLKNGKKKELKKLMTNKLIAKKKRQGCLREWSNI